MRTNYRVNKETNTKICNACLTEKDLSDFYMTPRGKAVYPTSQCKPCFNKKSDPLVYLRKNMISRCYNTSHPMYYRYGGRGISVCKAWLNSSKSFKKWCKENGWADGLYLDRINNDGNYTPTNCRFVTPTESTMNRSISIIITCNGESKSISEWSKITGIKPDVMYRRFTKGNLISYLKEKLALSYTLNHTQP